MSVAAQSGRFGAGDWMLIVIPDGHQRVRRFRLGPRGRRFLAGLLLLVVGMLQWALVELGALRARAARLPKIAAELALAQRQLHGVQAELRELDRSLTRMESQTARIQAITQLNDPERNVQMGPLHQEGARNTRVLYAQGERIDAEDEPLDQRAGLLVLDHALAHSQQAAHALQARQQSVLGFLAGREGLLQKTPSIFPCASHLVSSGFGQRLDLFTNQQVVHKGIDILADAGSAVWAPADGVVVFVGPRGEGMGQTVVLDHGFGVQTHFAHLGQVLVQPGQSVPRGRTFAEVGQSGRTMGTMLHYEVRFNGLPEDPRRFLLDDG